MLLFRDSAAEEVALSQSDCLTLLAVVKQGSFAMMFSSVQRHNDDDEEGEREKKVCGRKRMSCEHPELG